MYKATHAFLIANSDSGDLHIWAENLLVSLYCTRL